MAIYKVKDWDSLTASATADSKVQDIRAALSAFHAATRGTTEHGQSLLSILLLTRDWIAQPAHKSSPIFEAVCLLFFSAKKRMDLLYNYDKTIQEREEFYSRHQNAIYLAQKNYGSTIPNWEVARAQGLTGTLQDRSYMIFKGSSKPSLGLQLTIHDLRSGQHNYWLERADPLHRPWGHRGWELFEWWYDNVFDIDFFTWIEQNAQALIDHYENCGHPDRTACGCEDIVDLLRTDKGVQYLTDQERWRYRIKFHNGILMRRNPKKVHPGAREQKLFEVFTTRDLRTVFLGNGYAIWACSLPGASKSGKHKFYSHSHKLDRFHHTSFLAGADVLAAGEWVVSQGRIVYISNKTGHYQASPRDIYNAVRVLHFEKKVDLIDTLVCFTNFAAQTKTQDYYWAFDFLNAGGDLNNIECLDSVPLGKPDNLREQVRKYALSNTFPSGVYMYNRKCNTSFVSASPGGGLAPRRRMKIGGARNQPQAPAPGVNPPGTTAMTWTRGRIRY